MRPSASTILTSTCGWTRPTVADAALERIVDARSGADRARLGHAVGDGDFAHVHVGDAALHHLDRAGRARHDAGAQRRQIEARELRMVELGDEHGRHAVKRGAALRRDGLERRQRIETFARITPSPRHA